jgi:tRNA (mo5U34)-methyltransferase
MVPLSKEITMSASSASDLKALVDECFWFHSIDLGKGMVTPGLKSKEILEKEFEGTFKGIDIIGKTVLDVGAWNGAFTVEAARRGAAHVTALDHVTWNIPVLQGRRSFDLVVRERSIPATAVDFDVDAPSMSLAHLGKFDVVLFLGVFYHLKDPIAALREVAHDGGEVLVVETYVDRELDPKPAMVFFPGAELAGDPTNWWGPSCACVEALLKTIGFGRVESCVGAAPNRQVFHAWWK